VAYYVRLYAVDQVGQGHAASTQVSNKTRPDHFDWYPAHKQAVKLERRHKEITALLTAALNSLEKAKSSLTLDQEQDRYRAALLPQANVAASLVWR
jgi:hypothetical protein